MGYLLQADPHGLLIKGRFLPYTPPQVNGLEPAAMLHARLTELGEYSLLKRVALLLKVTESGANEEAEGFACFCHGQAFDFSLHVYLINPGRRHIILPLSPFCCSLQGFGTWTFEKEEILNNVPLFIFFAKPCQKLFRFSGL